MKNIQKSRAEKLAEHYNVLPESEQTIHKTESYNKTLDFFDKTEVLEIAAADPKKPFIWEKLDIEVHRHIDVNRDYGFASVIGFDDVDGQETYDLAFFFVSEWIAALQQEIEDIYSPNGDLHVA
ncbi:MULTISPECIES: hypothetical protein [Haloferax]|uniref:Uncharacterized protein n=1 Tax=Haloferax marinum TaxID=2666143 RepID=A0A6A8G853_9EURY|nr:MULTISPECIES: hypothetical protein [Haloferax]KAB1198124.1 hypothetical protein Hfx1150_11575 [Haloferax sp. CBA1150]MRW97201.1 hypothetical protein [Haloferax marinum]